MTSKPHSRQKESRQNSRKQNKSLTRTDKSGQKKSVNYSFEKAKKISRPQSANSVNKNNFKERKSRVEETFKNNNSGMGKLLKKSRKTV